MKQVYAIESTVEQKLMAIEKLMQKHGIVLQIIGSSIQVYENGKLAGTLHDLESNQDVVTLPRLVESERIVAPQS